MGVHCKKQKKALELEQYETLNALYNLALEFSVELKIPNFEDFLQRKEYAKNKLDEEDRLNTVYAIIKQKISFAKNNLDVSDIEEEINQLFKRSKINKLFYDNPKSVYQLLSIIRSHRLIKKEFHLFEPLIREKYFHLENVNAFNKQNHLYRLNLQYLLCHSLYRKREFTECLTLMDKFRDSYNDYNNRYFKRFIVRYMMLYAASLSFLGKAHEAIKLLEGLVKSSKIKDEERLGCLLNLGLYYFELDDWHNANKIANRIEKSDAWCEEKMGIDWLMKKNLMTIIIQYELENYELIIDMLNRFRQRFKSLYDHPLYARLKPFTQFIRNLINDPEFLNNKQKLKATTGQLQTLPLDEEDLHAINFYAWIRSKIEKRKYYTVLIELVQRPTP